MKKQINALLSFLFVVLSITAFSQTKVIRGNVVDEYGEAVIAATVKVTGTDIGVVTNIDGDFKIDAPSNAESLTISYVGMAQKIVPITSDNLSVTLIENDNIIEQVVVTTYGKDGQTPVTGSLSMVNSAKIEDIPIASVDQILQGKAPGLAVFAGSGQPGSSATVRIRGVGSITGSNTPLFILDGIQIEASELDGLNPNDLEVAAILKDASSTSIYGSRGANGVVVLKTKRGNQGRTQIQYRALMGSSRPGRQKFDMMNSNELLAFQEIAQRGAGWSLSPNNPSNANLSPARKAELANELARLRSIDNDFRDVFFRNGKTQSHDLSFRGGEGNTRFFTSFSYYKENGISLGSDFNRKSARLNLDHSVNERFKLSLQSSIAGTKSNFISSENGITLANPFTAVYLANPFETIRDEKGNILWQGNDPEGYNRFAGYSGSNAYSRLIDDSRERDQLKGTGVVTFEYSFLKDKNLTLTNRAGIDYRTRLFEGYTNPNSYGGSTVTRGEQGALSESTTKLRTLTVAPAINFDKEINDKNYINAIVGYEYMQRNFLSRSYTGYQLDPLYPGISPRSIRYVDKDSGEPIAVVGGSGAENRLSSGFFNVAYTYNDKYEIGGGIRQDGSSRFGNNKKIARFWNVGAKWVIDQEEFIKKSSKVDLLRLRLSYGTTGNQNIFTGRMLSDNQNFSYLPTLASGNNQGRITLAIDRLPNPDLQWESKTEANIGVDFGLFSNRLKGSVDFYNKLTDNLLIERAISGTTGQYGISIFNAGKMRNRGIDLELGVDVIQKKDFSLNLGANLNYNKNKILDLGGESQFESGTSIIRVGEEFGSHYIVGWAGVDPATGDPLYHDGKGGITKDFNAAKPTTGWGSSVAPYIGGFSSNLTWKDFSVSTQFNFAAKYRRFNNQTFFQENPNFAQFNLSRIMNTAWQKPGDITEVQRVGTTRRFTSKDIEDADFLRFRNLTASYSLNGVVKNLKGVSSAKVFMTGTNLYTWTRFTGFDPEDSDNIAQYEYPLPSQLTFGINLGL